MAIMTKGKGGALKASEVSNVPAGGIAATDVQAALNELDVDVTLNTAAKHAESHSIASHSDTTATGLELDTLTDDSLADALHSHSKLAASDGSPDPALSVGPTGSVGIGTNSPTALLELKSANPILNLWTTDVTGDPRVTFKDVGGTGRVSIGMKDDDANKLVFSSGSDLDTPRLVMTTAGNIGIGVSEPTASLHMEKTYASIDEIEPSFIINRRTSGIAANGIGNDFSFGIEETSGTLVDHIGTIGVLLTDASGARHGALVFGTRDGGQNTWAEGMERMRIDHLGRVGVGTILPGNPLAVNRSEDGIIVDFESADVVEGNVSILSNTTSYNAFVGSHYTQLKDGQKELPIGAVVISTGEIVPCEVRVEESTETKTEIPFEDAFETFDVETDLLEEIEIEGKIERIPKQIGEEFIEYKLIEGKVEKIMKPIFAKTLIQETRLKSRHTLDPETGKIFETITNKKTSTPDVRNKEYFPYIDTTTIAGDKRVYGVWLGKMADNSVGAAFGQNDKPIYLIAQVGLFKILCTEDGGDIEVGDYLETSTRPMLAQRQNSAVKVNSTVAKALAPVDWSNEGADLEFGCKIKLIPCIF